MTKNATNIGITIYFYSNDKHIVQSFFQSFIHKILPASVFELAQTLEIVFKWVVPAELEALVKEYRNGYGTFKATTIVNDNLLENLLGERRVNVKSDIPVKSHCTRYVCAWPMELVVGAHFFSNLLAEIATGQFTSYLLPKLEVVNTSQSLAAYLKIGGNYSFDAWVLDHLSESDKMVAKPSFRYNPEKLGVFTWLTDNVELIQYTNRYREFVWLEEKQLDSNKRGRQKILNNTRLFPSALLRNTAANIKPLEMTLLCMASEILCETENVLTDNFYRDPIIYSKLSSVATEKRFIASEFMETLRQWMKALSQANKTKYIDIPVLVRNRYTYELKLNLESFENKINALDKKHSGRTIVFWGMGEFTLFLLHSFKFCFAEVAVTDSDETKFVDNWHGYQCIKKGNLRDIDCVVIPASLNSYLAIQESIHEIYDEELPLEIVCWDSIG